MTHMPIRGISLHVKVIGHGYPLVLMHGGPGGDLYTLSAFKPLKDQFTLVFYDHRCNGRSMGPDVTTMTMENLTADADALRQALGFNKWAVLGHSFGGSVALEYALRYPQNLSHLILVNSGADYIWPSQKGPELLAQRGFSPEIVEVARRHFNGQFEPDEMFSNLMKLRYAYDPYMSLIQALPMLIEGLQSKLRPEACIFAETTYLQGWTVMDRLSEIKIPTLVMAGRQDFVYPEESQKELAAAIPNARLVLIDRAGHNPHDEQKAETIKAVREFMVEVAPGSA
ncbi:MAG: alpha/beta hydrolase [Anaerolineae bacterium]|nr:alpha/beta hydrolase [Anaerolineae bacterium]